MGGGDNDVDVDVDIVVESFFSRHDEDGYEVDGDNGVDAVVDNFVEVVVVDTDVDVNAAELTFPRNRP